MKDQNKWYMKDESVRELIDSISSPWDEYRNHPGQVALYRWADIQDFYYGIVIKNEILLLEYLNAPVRSKKIRKRLFKEVGESQYRIEATRRLYNYVSSISSLADHTRRLVRDYENSDFSDAYEDKLKQVTKLGEFAFLKDLRNYAAHFQIPPIGYIIGTNNLIDRNQAFLPVIYSGDLLDYDGWSKASKDYILRTFPQIELLDLVDVYAQAINKLYLWFFDQFNNLHGDDVKASELVKDEIIKRQI